MEFVKIAFCVVLVVAAVNAGDLPRQPLLKTVLRTTPTEGEATTNASITSSNLPVEYQEKLLKRIEEIYKSTTDGYTRLESFQAALMEEIPNFYWDAVTNFAYIMFYSQYNIRIFIENNDVIAFGK